METQVAGSNAVEVKEESNARNRLDPPRPCELRQILINIIVLIKSLGPAPFRELSITDRLLTPLILCSMILGVVLGEFAPKMREALNAAKFDKVSLRKSISLFQNSATLNSFIHQPLQSAL